MAILNSKRSKKRIFTLIVIAIGLLLFFSLLLGKPKPEPTEIPAVLAPRVTVMTQQPAIRAVSVRTQGTVAPRREIDLVTQVAGKVVSVSEDFAAGGFFDSSEQLLQIQDKDYRFALIRAEAKVADAAQLLATEKGRALQAKREWRELGSREANDLFLRKPQLASAEAALKAAEADRDEAKLNLDRTSIRSPYNGRVRETYVDIGQYVNAGTKVARFYSTDVVEVRLPLTDRQIGLLKLPLGYHGSAKTDQPVEVILISTFGGRQWQWRGRITRTDASIDVDSRVLYAVAEVSKPFDRGGEPGRPPLTIGQFVEAQIAGAEMDNVLVIPRRALRSENTVWTVGQDNVLRIKAVDVLDVRGDQLTVRLSTGWPGGPLRLIVSALNVAVDGMPVMPEQEGVSVDKPVESS